MKYEHITYIQKKSGRLYLCIDRLFENGERVFMTHFPLADVHNKNEALSLFDKASDWLGHSICIDNDTFREHIGLNSDDAWGNE